MARPDDSSGRSRSSMYQGLQWSEEMMVAGDLEAACIWFAMSEQMMVAGSLEAACIKVSDGQTR